MTSSSSKEPAVPPSRSDKGRVILTPRDWWALGWAAEQKALRYDHLGLLFALWQRRHAEESRPPDAGVTPSPRPLESYTPNAVRRIVQRWLTLDYARTEKPFATDPLWLWITAKGLRELNLPYEARFPMREDLPHLAAINQVRLTLAASQTYGGYTWVSERAIRARRAEGAKEVPYEHTPDAELHLEGTAQIAVEVECSAKSYDRLDTILRALTATYPQVFYAVTAQVCPVIFEAMLAVGARAATPDHAGDALAPPWKEG